MTSDDEFRQHAANAEMEARRALGEDREAWLRIAEGWMGLIRSKPNSESAAFEAQSAAIKTTDEDSSAVN